MPMKLNVRRAGTRPWGRGGRACGRGVGGALVGGLPLASLAPRNLTPPLKALLVYVRCEPERP